MYFHRTMVVIGLLCLLAGTAMADVTNTRWQLSLIRGSTTLETVYAPTEAEAWSRCAARIAEISETGNPTTVYICQTLRYYATAVSTCQPAPAPQTRTQTCPAGTTGNWTQTSTATVSAAPGCNVTAGPWLPATAPAGACVAQPPAPTVPRACTSRVCDVSWTPNGPADGFRIFYSRTNGTWANAPVQVGGTVTRTNVTMPDTGIWYFAVKSFIGADESALSNVVVRDVQ